MKQLINRSLLAFACAILMSACSSTDNAVEPEQQYQVAKSYLKSNERISPNDINNDDSGSEQRTRGFTQLQSLTVSNQSVENALQNVDFFGHDEKVTLAANAMPLNQFIHYAFGEVLGVNYVVGKSLKSQKKSVTMNVQNPVSKQELFKLLTSLLTREQVSIDFDENTFFLQKNEMSKAKAIIGIGRNVTSVPQVSGQILQVIPIKFDIKISLERTVRDLVDAKITTDYDQNALFVLGDRANILRAIELVELLDVPANRGRYIGLLTLQYISIDDFIEQATQLLNNEGLSVGTTNIVNKSVYMVALNNIGAIALFASAQETVQRVRYWATVLDQPAKGENAQYFVFNPSYARATDVGESVGRLLSLGNNISTRSSSTRSTGSNASELKSENTSRNIVSNRDVSFVVDERSNALIFSTTGDQYQKLLPLLKKLDVLPKQVLLEVMIAEVSLTDDFKYGVEFFLKNSSRFTASTLGSFGAGDTGGINFSFDDGSAEVAASFFRENRFVNVISNPSILVRDGVSANISVGTDIPTVGGTVVDDGVTNTNVVYRRTGVNVTVTPTVNAKGVVIMSVTQSISNTVETTAEASSPSIFDRSLKTEVVVESGQTVLLGGLISENVSNGETKVPLLGDIPVLGKLFTGQNDSKSKTELVMMVTPKVIDSSEQWDKLIESFQAGLENLQIVD